MPDPRLLLVETSSSLPGLLPPVAHEALQRAVRVLARDPDDDPTALALASVGIQVQRAQPDEPGALAGMNLMSATGPASDVRLARGVLGEARSAGEVAYLLGPDDEGFGRTVAMEAAKTADVEIEFVFLVGAPRGLELLRLVEVMAALRHPETGCPWDLQQDHEGLARYLVEETYELLDAIGAGDDEHLAEELGDVLLQVVFHAQVAADRRAFDIDSVARGIVDKLVRRHPHVFGDGDAETPEEVQANWDQLKKAEKAERTSPLDGVPTALPALMFAEELQRKAAKDDLVPPPPDPRGAVDEALRAFDEATGDAASPALGDLLFALVAYARDRGLEPETALRGQARAFRQQVDGVAEG